jgi:hypothetical protein
MFENKIVDQPSRHPSYHEKGTSFWLRPGSLKVTAGDEEGSNGLLKVPSDNGGTVFYMDDYMKKKQDFEQGKLQDKLERALAGWSDEYVNDFQTYLEAENKAKKTGSKPSYAGLIEPTHFQAFKSLPRIIQVFTQITEEHNLLDTVRVVNIDDINGIGIYDVGQVEEDYIQRGGAHTIPYDIAPPTISKQIMEPKRYQWRVTLSDEWGIVNFDLPNLENLMTNTLGQKVNFRRNRDVAGLINLTGNSGTQNDWTALNTAETRYANPAFDDIKELLRLIDDQRYGSAEFIGMHPDVYDAFYFNMTPTAPAGFQQLAFQPYTYDNSTRKRFDLFPAQEIVVDSLLTAKRFYVWRRDSIFHVFGGIRAVQFENREVGYSGTTFRGYWNTAKIKSNLIKGGTGVIP